MRIEVRNAFCRQLRASKRASHKLDKATLTKLFDDIIREKGGDPNSHEFDDMREFFVYPDDFTCETIAELLMENC